MTTLYLKIFGLDCAEEIGILKRELKPLIPEERLGFDLINGKLIVNDVDDSITTQHIIDVIQNTGMRAVAWNDYIKQQHLSTWWLRHGRGLLLLLSLLWVMTGVGWHAWQGHWWQVLSGDHLQSHYPWFTKLCYSLAIVCGGWFVFPKAWYALRRGHADMNLLMVIAVVGAVIIQQWFEAATVTLLFALALYLESWSIAHARNSIKTLMDLVPPTAHIYCPTSGKLETSAIGDIALETLVLVRPGEKIPLDGIITKGASHINEAPITGESLPIYKSLNDAVYAGTINGDHSIEFKVTKTSENTTLAHITHMIEEAQHRKATTEQWIDRFASYYTPLMILLAIVLALLPPLVLHHSWLHSFYEALVILVIACPCALVISTPISIVAGLSLAARHGILIKGGRYLELPATLAAIAFDKTATLTQGNASVKNIIAINGHTNQELLALAAALEVHSDHPIAKAVLQEAKAQAIDFDVAENFKIIHGKGAMGVIHGVQHWIGSHRMLHELMPEHESEYLHHNALALEQQGHSLVALGNDSHICGLISVADTIRPECRDAMEQLLQLGIKHIMMLTGDNAGTAAAIAQQCHISEYQAELLPQDKVAAIATLVKNYQRVAMVGDGINDAPALAVATLGIAMGVAGSDLAIETADIALMSDDLTKIPWLIRHSRRVLRTIKQNITLALSLKAIFIGLAIAGIATLWMAISADMGASLLVIMNSLRLLRRSRLAAIPSS